MKIATAFMFSLLSCGAWAADLANCELDASDPLTGEFQSGTAAINVATARASDEQIKLVLSDGFTVTTNLIHRTVDNQYIATVTYRKKGSDGKVLFSESRAFNEHLPLTANVNFGTEGLDGEIDVGAPNGFANLVCSSAGSR
jgi:hypothetical protein